MSRQKAVAAMIHDQAKLEHLLELEHRRGSGEVKTMLAAVHAAVWHVTLTCYTHHTTHMITYCCTHIL